MTRNTTGLHNQNFVSTDATGYASSRTSEPDERESLRDQRPPKRVRALSSTSSQDTSDNEEKDWHRGAIFDTLKFMADESDEDDELEEGGDNAMFTGVDEAEFCAQLEELAVNAGDDPLDATWLPPKQA
ncbi:hypothetical protein EDC04DRAFT_3060173, partial [Pisolithus marmoratus]